MKLTTFILSALITTNTFASDIGICKDDANDNYENCIAATNDADQMAVCQAKLDRALEKCDEE